MDSIEWDERYAAAELVWSAGPNRWVEEITADLPAGRAIDLGAGEGRNALWLAERGWDVTAVDFSSVGLDRMRGLAANRPGIDLARLHAVEADLGSYTPDRGGFDLVIVVYIHLLADVRQRMHRAAADAVAPGGLLVVVGHDVTNLAHGVGGPQEPARLFTADDLAEDVAGTGLQTVRAERVTRTVATPEGDRDALDALLVARRPT